MADERWLYLFSSDQTVRYAQDVLNILGLPHGARYRFRYDLRWIHGDDFRERLAKDGLRGQPGLVCFSMQHPSFYSPASFIPVRLLEVAQSERVGTHIFIHFYLRELVALPPPASRSGRHTVVEAFTTAIHEMCEAPYDFWASLGRIPVSRDLLNRGGDEEEYFEVTAGYLSGAAAFREARFLRFHKCAEAGRRELQPGQQRLPGDPPEPVVQKELTGDPPSLNFTAGKTYDLELLQFVPEGGPGSGSFSIADDGSVVRLVGEPAVRIGSRYDKPVLILAAPNPAEYGTRSTTLVIEPDPGTTGPRLEIPIRVESSIGGAAGKAFLTACGLVVLALPAVLHVSTGVRILMVAVGAVIASVVQVFGRRLPELPEAASFRDDAGGTSPPGAPHFTG